MDLDRVFALAKRVRQRLNCSQQQSEYIASLLGCGHNVSKESFVLLAEIQAIHSIRTRYTVRSGRN
jgi:hypothetical protein